MDIKIGFIGMGYIGRIHAIALRALPLVHDMDLNIKFAGVCKRNLNDVPNIFGYKTSDIDEFLGIDMDAVDICTPNYLHADQIYKAAERNLNIYVEKPLGLNLTEAKNIAGCAGEKKFINQTALMYRFMPAVAQARDMIANGEIGKVLNFKAKMLHSGYLDTQRPISWRLRKETSGGGAIVDMGIHLIDTVRFMMGEVESVRAVSKTFFQKRPVSKTSDKSETVDVDDWTLSQLQLKSGAWGEIEASRISASQEEVTIFEVYGTDGSIKISSKSPEYCELFKKWDDTTIKGRYERQSAYTEYLYAIYPNEKYSMGYMVNMHMTSLLNFLLNIRDKKINYAETPNFIEAYKSQKVLDGILLSAENDGGTVKV